MSKHTPGKWINVHGSVFKEDEPRFPDFDKPIVIGVAISGVGGEALANANLIAAAPELLDKLEVALKRLQEKSNDSSRDFGLINSIKVVIAKATGGDHE